MPYVEDTDRIIPEWVASSRILFVYTPTPGAKGEYKWKIH